MPAKIFPALIPSRPRVLPSPANDACAISALRAEPTTKIPFTQKLAFCKPLPINVFLDHYRLANDAGSARARLIVHTAEILGETPMEHCLFRFPCGRETMIHLTAEEAKQADLVLGRDEILIRDADGYWLIDQSAPKGGAA